MFTRIYLLLECYKSDLGRVVRYIVRKDLFIDRKDFIIKICIFST